VADLERFLALLEALRQSLVTLDRYQQTVDRERLLRDVDAQNMVLFALYRAVQGAIDLGQHLIAELSLPVPAAYREVFRSLADAGLLTSELGAKLQGWAGFRNIIAHDYGVLDMQLVAQALHADLVDLHEFAKAMATHAVTDPFRSE
jgi:uncharacterized protein YutE (UPF0331/DUF86 family)